MTDAQDLILDKLVGSKVGVNWPDGPLALAAAALGPEPIRFETKSFDGQQKAKLMISERLGLPVSLIEAIQGGVRGLADPEHRRAYSMLLFRSLPISGVAKRTNVATTRREAIFLAVRAHQIVCQDRECWMARLLVGHAVGGKASSTAVLYSVPCSHTGEVVANPSVHRLTNNATPAARMMYAVERAINGFTHRDLLQAHDALREATRVVAAVGGVAPAVEMLLHMARRCGLKVESV